MKVSSMAMAVVVSLVTMASVFAEGGNVGNGGITIVCRETPVPPRVKGKIIYARLLDLWAPDTFETNDSDEAWEMQLRVALGRTRNISAFSTAYLEATIQKIIKEEVSSKLEKMGADGFELPNDFLPAYKLSAGCEWEALGRYEFIPELGREGLRKNREIFEYFEANGRQTDIAAFYYHEGLYKLYRNTHLQSALTPGSAQGKYDSRIVQGLVALAFSEVAYSDAMRVWFARATISQLSGQEIISRSSKNGGKIFLKGKIESKDENKLVTCKPDQLQVRIVRSYFSKTQVQQFVNGEEAFSLSYKDNFQETTQPVRCNSNGELEVEIEPISLKPGLLEVGIFFTLEGDLPEGVSAWLNLSDAHKTFNAESDDYTDGSLSVLNDPRYLFYPIVNLK